MIPRISPNAPSSSLADAQLDASSSIKEKLAAKAKQPDPKMAHVAQQFEEVFVRQLLSSAKMGGEKEEGGFGAMTIDALATGVSQGGGLGIAKSIEMAMTHYGSTPAPISASLQTPEKSE
jgi:Rod binding domain-containing protein